MLIKQRNLHVFKDTFSQIWLLQWKVENLFEGFTNKNLELFFSFVESMTYV